MNVYQLVLAEAKKSEETHYQRQAMALRRWFRNHMECRYRLLPMDWRETQLRSVDDQVAVEYRHGPGWWGRVTDDPWVGLPQQRGKRPGLGWQLPPESISEQEYESEQNMKQLELAI